MSAPSPEFGETALLQKAIAACIRAQGYARREDRVWLAMAAALLRCDVAERRVPATASVANRPTGATSPHQPIA